MQNMSSIENCNLKTIMLLDKLCKKKSKQNKELSFWLFLYQNSEYVSEKNLSNQSLLND